jgi:hypothetical protein
LKKKYAIIRELRQLDPHGNKQIWRQDIDVLENVIGSAMCLFDLQCDDSSLATLTITDVTQNYRLFSQVCYFMCYMYTPSTSSRIWMINVFQRLLRIARCRGTFSRECYTVNFTSHMGREPIMLINPRNDLNFTSRSFMLESIRSDGFFPNDICYVYDEREMSFSIDEFCTSLKYPGLYGWTY